MTVRQPAAFLLALTVMLAMTTACSAPDGGSLQADPAAELRPVPEPDLAGAEPQVREQIRDQQRLVERLQTGGEPSELADAYGRLGLIFVTYEFLAAAEACFDNARRLSDEDYRWIYLHGYLLKIQGRPDEALVELARALALRPDDPAILIRVADTQFELGDHASAKRDFERARQLNPSSAAALEGLAKLAAAAGEHAEAARLYDAALELQPTATSLHYALGQTYRRLGDLERAGYHLERRGDSAVLVDDPLLEPIAKLARSASFYLTQAEKAMQNKLYDAAVDSYRQALEYAPDDLAARRGLAFALVQLGDPDGAIAQLEKGVAELRPQADGDAAGLAAAHLLLSQLLTSKGRESEALVQLERAFALEPGRFEIRLQLADALARGGRLAEAVDHYSALLESGPPNPGVLVKRATARINLGQSRLALEDFRQAVEVAPDSAEVRSSYADALEYLGDAAGAAAQRAALRDSADADDRALVRAHTARQMVQRGDYLPAVAAYREALQAVPGAHEVRFELASVLGHLGRYGEAESEFRRIIEALPRHGPARRGLITALLLQERWVDARLALRDALQALPRDGRLAHALARLLAIAPDPAARDARLGLELAQRVHQLVNEPASGATLAMALAEAGRASEAVALLAAQPESGGAQSEAERRLAEARLEAFRRGEPWRATSPAEIVEALGARPAGG
jgi:tetratricopeptide (TPR) repeat protein